MEEKKKYRVASHMFVGRSEDGERYTYEITFNKSLRHTGMFTGIEDGLNQYAIKEAEAAFKSSIPNVWYRFVNWIKILKVNK